MADQVRFASIGLSFAHGRALLESLLLMPEVEVVALHDPDPVAARRVVPEGARALPLYGDVGELLAKERPEAVVVTMPSDATPGAIIQAAEAGAHVFADKPCARSAAEFLPAAEAVRKAGVKFHIGYTRRSRAVGGAMKDLVDRGLLGRLVSAEARWVTTSVTVRNPAHYFFSKERSGGGLMHVHGCHWLDLIRWVSSAEVTEVAAIMDNLSGQPITVEDTVAVSLRYSNGMIGTIHGADVRDRGDDNFFALRGTDGWLQWDQSGPDMLVRSTRPEWVAAPTRVLRFEPDDVGGYGGGAGIASFRRFIAAFRDGAEPLFTPDDALRVLETVDAAQESARTGRRVNVGDGRLRRGGSLGGARPSAPR